MSDELEISEDLPCCGLETSQDANTVDQKWMRRALQLAEFAEAAGEVPVGAVIVRNEVVLGSGHNAAIASNRPTAHAELMALDDAARRIGNYRLPGATLYVTLEPCTMCAGAIVNARLERVVYAAADPRAGACGSALSVFTVPGLNHYPLCTGGVYGQRSGQMLRRFFRSRR